MTPVRSMYRVVPNAETYGDIGTEPWTYPYYAPVTYRTEEHGVVSAKGALKTPLVLGPGWYKGAEISYTPTGPTQRPYGRIGDEPFMSYIKPSAFQPAAPPVGVSVPVFPGPGWHVGPPIAYTPSKVPPMLVNRSARRFTSRDHSRARNLSYGAVGNFFGPPVGVGPVRDPVGGMVRPAGPVHPAPYVPSDLPIINPSPGYHIGPSVYSSIPVGMGYGAAEMGSKDDLSPSMTAALGKGLAGLMVGAGVGVLGGFLVAVESSTLFDLVLPKRTEKQDATMTMVANAVAAAVAVGGIFLGGKYAYDQYNAAKAKEV
jgi:hypothetical protein